MKRGAWIHWWWLGGLETPRRQRDPPGPKSMMKAWGFGKTFAHYKLSHGRSAFSPGWSTVLALDHLTASHDSMWVIPPTIPIKGLLDKFWRSCLLPTPNTIMFSTSLFLQRPTTWILIIFCHALLGPFLNPQIAFVDSYLMTFNCNREFVRYLKYFNCVDDPPRGATTVGTNNCYLLGPTGTHKPLDQLVFPDCWTKEKRYAGVRAIQFRDNRTSHVIYVYEGQIINSTDHIPKHGLTCAWSKVRPQCQLVG
ncbi:hypothetical protein O181_071801 [Austropuccinia psidii MF-1]|uniref:Uncharacterized protein n=1 Tax=Austropuccinia psidii MF-1 TaxID=1389203 RepID=A0A9Q3F7Z6_9BASI|nr:hypothetical protein [Austropuccinia psidii MF-1]